MTDLDIRYTIGGMSQPNETACWATALAMLINYSEGANYDPETLAQEAGYSIEACNGWDAIYAIAEKHGLYGEGAASRTIEGWAELLQSYGPLWLVVDGVPSHAVVLNGVYGDGSEDGTKFVVTDPWYGEQEKTLAELDSDFGGAAGKVGENFQIMHR
ncbi:MAG TPA: papain-like cysteine protease family protein [Actinophytocola sp.]|uniref:papain-like cysteine protease family protein n=1 Tax=Actinophytocola sp. TaxID=1872138 RepID=UPI002DDDA515|nr:papain-like cysteine protease family protein [Actinophytocola sp.]HEV2779811.1 papain-like cysteine protease family protein [Actinophytocola sp.]